MALEALYLATDEPVTDGWMEGETAWTIDVDPNTGIAYTNACDLTNEGSLAYPSDDEIEHVQKFHRGDYCQRGQVHCVVGCYEGLAGTW